VIDGRFAASKATAQAGAQSLAASFVSGVAWISSSKSQ
jgi:hypothetical protein